MDLLSVRPPKGRGTEHGDFVNPAEGVRRRVEGQESEDPRKLTGRIGCQIFKPDQLAPRAVSTRKKGQNAPNGLAPD